MTPIKAIKILREAPPKYKDAILFLMRHVAEDSACRTFGAERIIGWAADEIEGKDPDLGLAGEELPF